MANNPELQDDQVKEINYDNFYDILTARKLSEERIEDWRDFLVEQELLSKSEEEILNYAEDLWLKKAFVYYNEEKFSNRIS